MKVVKVRCPHCDKKVLEYDDFGIQKYGNPVRHCPKCGGIYIDPRYTELALEGIPQWRFSIVSYLIIMVVGALIACRGIYLYGFWQLGTPANAQWFTPTAFCILGVAFILFSIYEMIIIVTGIKKEKYQRMLKESEQRLQDANYAYTLKNLGFHVPEKYL